MKKLTLLALCMLVSSSIYAKFHFPVKHKDTTHKVLPQNVYWVLDSNNAFQVEKIQYEYFIPLYRRTKVFDTITRCKILYVGGYNAEFNRPIYLYRAFNLYPGHRIDCSQDEINLSNAFYEVKTQMHYVKCWYLPNKKLFIFIRFDGPVIQYLDVFNILFFIAVLCFAILLIFTDILISEKTESLVKNPSPP
jgi:hypothetical protein